MHFLAEGWEQGLRDRSLRNAVKCETQAENAEIQKRKGKLLHEEETPLI